MVSDTEERFCYYALSFQPVKKIYELVKAVYACVVAELKPKEVITPELGDTSAGVVAPNSIGRDSEEDNVVIIEIDPLVLSKDVYDALRLYQLNLMLVALEELVSDYKVQRTFKIQEVKEGGNAAAFCVCKILIKHLRIFVSA